MQHIPVCLNCESNEVQAPYTFRDGSGFCSGSCEDHANNIEYITSQEYANDLAYESYKDSAYTS